MDREKVIRGLEICTKEIPMSNAVHKSDFCKECPYYNAKNRYCWNQIAMMRDALALLKEQETTMVIESENMYTGLPITHCPKCGVTLDRFWYGRQHEGQINYCPMCGQAIKWE